MRILDALTRSDLVVVTRAWRAGGDARPMSLADFGVDASAADVTEPSAAVTEVREHFASQEEQP